jgi:hypothetical protein
MSAKKQKGCQPNQRCQQYEGYQKWQKHQEKKGCVQQEEAAECLTTA